MGGKPRCTDLTKKGLPCKNFCCGELPWCVSHLRAHGGHLWRHDISISNWHWHAERFGDRASLSHGPHPVSCGRCGVDYAPETQYAICERFGMSDNDVEHPSSKATGLPSGAVVEDEDTWQAKEARQQSIIEAADSAADRIIMDGSDGSVEMTNSLTAQLALTMMARAVVPFGLAVLRKRAVHSHPDSVKVSEPNKESAVKDEIARQQSIVEAADMCANRIIVIGSNSSVEMTSYLTAQVALKMVTRALQPFGAAMLRKELAERHPTLAKACEFGPRFGSPPPSTILLEGEGSVTQEEAEHFSKEDIDTLDKPDVE